MRQRGVAPGDTDAPEPGLAFVCHPYHRGGVTRWMVDAAMAWCRAGGRCWFVVPRPRRPFRNGGGRLTVIDLLNAEQQHERPAVHVVDVDWRFEFGTSAYRALTYARAILASVPPSVPLVASDDPDAWTAAAWLGGRNPFIAVLHADEERYYDRIAQFDHAVAAWVGVSSRITARAKALRGTNGVAVDDRGVMATIPCGVPLPVALPDRRSAAPDGAKPVRIAWVGRMDERQKRVSDLPRIGAALREAGIAFHLRVIGDGPARPAVERAAREMGLARCIEFLGWCATPEVLALLGESDVLLQPSNFEGMSVTAMEALACGCAVVASRTSGLEDYEGREDARQCLWLFPVGDVRAAADCVRAAAALAPEERRERAMALARAEFSIERCMDRYRDLVARLSPPARGVAPRLPIAQVISRVISVPLALARAARVAYARREREGGAGAAPPLLGRIDPPEA